MKRIIAHNTVLGIDGLTFHLVKGEEIEVLDRDKYNRIRVVIQGKEVLMNGVMLDRVSNDPVIPTVAYSKDTMDVLSADSPDNEDVIWPAVRSLYVGL